MASRLESLYLRFSFYNSPSTRALCWSDYLVMKSLPILAVALAILSAVSFCQDQQSASNPGKSKVSAFENPRKAQTH